MGPQGGCLAGQRGWEGGGGAEILLAEQQWQAGRQRQRRCCASLVDRSHPWIQRTSHGYHNYSSRTHTPIVSYCWSHGPNSTIATQLSMDRMSYPSQQDWGLVGQWLQTIIAIAVRYRSCSRSRSIAFAVMPMPSGVALALALVVSLLQYRSHIQVLQLHLEYQPFMRCLLHLFLLGPFPFPVLLLSLVSNPLLATYHPVVLRCSRLASSASKSWSGVPWPF